MAAAPQRAEDELHASWVFTAEALQRARQAAHACALQGLRSATAEGLLPPRASGRAKEKAPPDAEQASRYALFYAQQLPKLCGFCGAPPEARWTAIVFFRRFFALRSPLEFNPMHLMFAAMHLACKVEEFHEITLDSLLKTADFSGAIRGRVAALELPLLEAIGFSLLVEPKPDTALRVLAADLRQLLQQQLGVDGAPSAPQTPAPGAEASPPNASRGAAAARAALELLDEEASRSEVLQEAEELLLRLSVRTDAVLRSPASVLVAGALAATLDAASTRRRGGEEGPQRSAPSEALMSLLDANLEAEPQRAALRRLLEEVQEAVASDVAEVPVAEVEGTASAAKGCLRAFERLREEATERHEAHRKERKRRYSQMARGARRGVPTPVHQALSMRTALQFDDVEAERPAATFVPMAGGAAGGTSASTVRALFGADDRAPAAAAARDGTSGALAAAASDEAFGAGGGEEEGFFLHSRGDTMDEDED